MARRTLAIAVTLLFAAQVAAAQPAATPAAPAQQRTATPPPSAPPGGSKEIGFGAIIGLVAGVMVLGVLFSD